MNRRTVGVVAIGAVALWGAVMVSRSDLPDTRPLPRRSASRRPAAEEGPSPRASSARVESRRPASAWGRPSATEAQNVHALLELLKTDLEQFLDRIDGDREARELADARLFPRGGAIPDGERRERIESLWTMALAGRRAAALLLGRFELEEASLARTVDYLRSTADGAIASWIVQGLRNSRPNLERAGAPLAEALRFQLARQDDPAFLGGLADLSPRLAKKLPASEWIGIFAAYWDPEYSEEMRVQAVRGAGAWPEATPLLVARCSVETSPAVRLAILHATARRAEGRECLLRALGSDPNPDVRRFAAEKARMVCDRAAVGSLERAVASEPDDRVVRALQDSIDALSRGGTR